MPIDAVVKIGGSLLRRPAMYDTALRTVADAALDHAIAIVPGGGPFSDLARAFDRAMSLGDETAHWLAIRGMDAHAEVLAHRLPAAVLAELPDDVTQALAERRIPVLAPSRWLRQRDPLPHSWDVTSDSIAAWVAGELEATRLVLLKPVSGDLGALADAYFARALPPHVHASVIDIDGLCAGGLHRELRAAVLAKQ